MTGAIETVKVDSPAEVSPPLGEARLKDIEDDKPYHDDVHRQVEGEVCLSDGSSMPHSFEGLPPEIISMIAAALADDTSALKSLRGVNKMCTPACTRLLFREINLLLDNKSMGHLHCILGNPAARLSATSLRINTAEYTDRNMDTFDWDDRDEELLKLFNHYLARVGRFPNLKALAFKFSKACVAPPLRRHWWASQVPESVGFRTEALQGLFKGLNDAANLTPRFHSLSIENLQDYNDDALVKSEDFVAVMGRIDRLALQIATEHDEDGTVSFIEKKELHNFFNTQLQQDWLSHCQHNLTRLTLYATRVYWGYLPKCILPHFPRLKSLALGKMTFTHDTQLQWLLSHYRTLEQLTLDDCPIVIGAALYTALDEEKYPIETSPIVAQETPNTFLYPARWHTYFCAFRTELPQLRSLRCGYGDWMDEKAYSTSPETLEATLWPQRYRVLDGYSLLRPPFINAVRVDEEGAPEAVVGRGDYEGTWQEVPTYPDCTDEDLIELVKLRSELTARSGVIDEGLEVLKEALF